MLDKIAGIHQLLRRAGGRRRATWCGRSRSCARVTAWTGLAGIGIGVPGFILLKEGVITQLQQPAVPRGFPDPRRDRAAPEHLRHPGERRQRRRAGREVDGRRAATWTTWSCSRSAPGIGGGIISGGRVLHGCARHGRRTGPHDRRAERQSLRLRQSGLPRKTRLRHRRDRHGAAAATWATTSPPKEVYDLAKQAATRRRSAIWTHDGRALGVALAMLVNTFNFPLYLLSGGVLPAWEFFAPPMLEDGARGARSPSAPPTPASKRRRWATRPASTARPTCPGSRRARIRT